MKRRRLICPKCGAKYEVDPNLIPAHGRDVQCSNCGHTWFEAKGEDDAASAVTPAAPVAAPPVPKAPQPPVSEETTLQRVSGLMAQDAPDEVEDPPALDEAAEVPGEDLAMPEPPKLDEAVRNLLREEATRETDARGKDAKTGSKMSRILGRDRAPEPAPQPAGSRRDLLPDIEEINSSLKSSQKQFADDFADSDVDTRRGGGFRKGFFLVVILFLIGLLVYIFADQLIAQFPAAEVALDTYVDWVDRLRITLDAQVQSWIEALKSMSDSPEAAPAAATATQ